MGVVFLLWFLAFVGQGVGVLFPVLPVEVDYGYGFWLFIQAAQVDVHAIRVGAGDVKRLDATNTAKGMFGHATVKGVSLQLLLATQQSEVLLWHDQVQVTGLGTDGTVTVFDFNLFRCIHFKGDGAAMAAP